MTTETKETNDRFPIYIRPYKNDGNFISFSSMSLYRFVFESWRNAILFRRFYVSLFIYGFRYWIINEGRMVMRFSLKIMKMTDEAIHLDFMSRCNYDRGNRKLASQLRNKAKRILNKINITIKP